MDWWTIFYWGWWISWAPFVGIFLAIISRGRTVRNVIIGGFFAPCLFCFLWFAVFGGVAIKMQRVGELALGVKPDWQHGTVNCDDHYNGGGEAISDLATKLEADGYFMLACRPFVTQIYDVMMPYTNLRGFYQVLLWIGLFFYFITSSDSGSFVDDTLGSSGMTDPPVIQKIYWAFTEGIVATVLIISAGNATSTLKSLRSVSICAGLPLTFLMCNMTCGLYRAVKYENGDEDVRKAKKFNTQLFDFLEGFQPTRPSPYAPSEHASRHLLALFFPYAGIKEVLDHLDPDSPTGNLVTALFAEALHLLWFCLMIAEVAMPGAHTIAWISFCFFLVIVAFSRYQLRGQYGIWGSYPEDFWISMMLWPFAIGQMQMQCANNGEGMPTLFQEVEEMLVKIRAYDAKLAGGEGAAMLTDKSKGIEMSGPV